jgi:hypothetical protein
MTDSYDAIRELKNAITDPAARKQLSVTLEVLCDEVRCMAGHFENEEWQDAWLVFGDLVKTLERWSRT